MLVVVYILLKSFSHPSIIFMGLRLGPAQDFPYALILWYVLKTSYFS